MTKHRHYDWLILLQNSRNPISAKPRPVSCST